MPWLIFALGLVLASAGGAAIAHGYPYMQIEFGWTEVIAGSVAVSGGIVTIAIGAVLRSLSSWRAAMERQAASRTSIVPAAHEEPRVQAAVAPPPEEAEPAPVVPAKPEEPRRPAMTERPVADARRKTLRGRTAALEQAAEPVPTPTTVGRYESGGSSYVLFSDGTIEVEGKGGTRRFGSMDELRSFMAAEDAREDRVTATT